MMKKTRWRGGKNCSRLLRFIPGKTLYEVDTWTKEHFFQCGEFVARMDLSLQTFKHPGEGNISI